MMKSRDLLSHLRILTLLGLLFAPNPLKAAPIPHCQETLADLRKGSQDSQWCRTTSNELLILRKTSPDAWMVLDSEHRIWLGQTPTLVHAQAARYCVETWGANARLATLSEYQAARSARLDEVLPFTQNVWTFETQGLFLEDEFPFLYDMKDGTLYFGGVYTVAPGYCVMTVNPKYTLER
jgi:hypothetical protein